jgi:hypothetical protein
MAIITYVISLWEGSEKERHRNKGTSDPFTWFHSPCSDLSLRRCVERSSTWTWRSLQDSRRNIVLIMSQRGGEPETKKNQRSWKRVLRGETEQRKHRSKTPMTKLTDWYIITTKDLVQLIWRRRLQWHRNFCPRRRWTSRRKPGRLTSSMKYVMLSPYHTILDPV